MAMSVFHDLGYQDQIGPVMKETFEEHTCPIKANIPLRNIMAIHDSRFGITGGILNAIMLGCGPSDHQKRSKLKRRVTHPIVENTKQSKEKKERM
jgi:hypothetical protein